MAQLARRECFVQFGPGLRERFLGGCHKVFGHKAKIVCFRPTRRCSKNCVVQNAELESGAKTIEIRMQTGRNPNSLDLVFLLFNGHFDILPEKDRQRTASTPRTGPLAGLRAGF
jgi:hypothetical protein